MDRETVTARGHRAPPRIIAFHGRMGSGKSTACELLRAHGYREVSFAAPLKRVALALGFEHHQVYGSQRDKLETNTLWGVSGREFLQRFGTEICRDTLPRTFPAMPRSLWCALMRRELAAYADERFAISDCRFEDEARLVRELGGVVVHLHRDDAGAPADAGAASQHRSERELSLELVDAHVDNNGSPRALQRAIDRVLATRTRVDA